MENGTNQMTERSDIAALRKMKEVAQSIVDDGYVHMEVRAIDIVDLIEKLEVAKKALEFYASEKNWRWPMCSNWGDKVYLPEDDMDIIASDIGHERNNRKYGGKRAREALKRLEK